MLFIIVEWVVEVSLALILGAAALRLFVRELPEFVRNRRRRALTAESAESFAEDADAEDRPERVSFVDGLLERDPADEGLQARVEEVLDWVVAAAPADKAPPEACSCIRADGPGFVGVVRIGSRAAHCVRTVRAPSRRKVALLVLDECSRWRGPPRVTRADQHEECDERLCPGGAVSVPPPAPAQAA